MIVLNPFRFDVRRAIVATPRRRWLAYGSSTVLVLAAIVLGGIAPWWTWLVLVGLDLAVFTVLGSRWAGQDALRAEQDSEDS
jgi:hypothetical protein